MILLATSEGIDQKADLGFCWSNMPEDTVSHGATQISFWRKIAEKLYLGLR